MAKKEKKSLFTEENVYSPINDDNIRNDIKNSTIWKKCFHESEYKEFINDFANMHCYSIKFSGLTPVQVTKVERLK